MTICWNAYINFKMTGPCLFCPSIQMSTKHIFTFDLDMIFKQFVMGQTYN